MKPHVLPAVITLISLGAFTGQAIAQPGSWQNSWAQERSGAKERCAETFDQFQLQKICVDNEREGHQKMQGNFGMPPKVAERAKRQCAAIFDQLQLQAVCMENERDGYRALNN
jgi:hypothetical protein